MSINLARLVKLERAALENRREKYRRQNSTIDFSNLTDDELDALYTQYVTEHPFPATTRYDGLTEHQLSDLYMADIRAGQLKFKK